MPRPFTQIMPFERRCTEATPGAVLMDSSALSFAAETLVVQTRCSRLALPLSAWDQPGAYQLQLDALTDCGNYLRRFALGPWGSVEITVAPFRYFRLTVLENSFLAVDDQFDLTASLTDGQASSQVTPLLYRETVTAAAGVPWGAFELVPAVADPGFAWDLAGTSIPQPVTVGNSFPVLGVRYVPSVATFTGIWRIRA